MIARYITINNLKVNLSIYLQFNKLKYNKHVQNKTCKNKTSLTCNAIPELTQGVGNAGSPGIEALLDKAFVWTTQK